jgi:hypothetical protein
MYWGGGAAAADTELYRIGAGILATTGELRAGSLTTTGILNLGAGSYIYHNSNPVGNGVILARGAGDIDQRYTLSNDGHMYWGPGVSAGIDVELRRSAAGQLRIEGGLNITTFLEFNARTPGSAIIAAAANGDTAYRYTQGNDGSMNWGPGNAAGDTQLVRSGVGELTTYGRFIVGQRAYVGTDLVVDNSGTGSKLYFGQLSDCVLYRSAANSLKTDGHFVANLNIYLDQGNAGNRLVFGSANDIYLYRAAAGVLKTDGALAVAGDYATTLPASPVDGQIATLVDSLTAPTYIWRFRYVAGIADAYKWVFIGGGPLLASGAAVDSSASTSYVFVSGPTLTFPRAGIYDVEFGASFYHSGGGANAQVGLSYNNAAVADADAAGARLDSLATSAPLAMTAWRKSNWTVASATTARMLMKTNSATLSAFARQIRAVPVRVA